MSEQQEKLENLAPEAVENMNDDKENAAPEKPVRAKAPKGKKSKKRRKKKGVPVAVVIILLVVAMIVGAVFGVVLGYGLGRNTSSGRLQEANEQIDELTTMVEDANAKEIDVFTDTLTAENAAALDELSGKAPESAVSGQTESMMSGEAFGGVEENPVENVIVAEYKGGSLTSVEVNEEYNRRMTSFIFAGFQEEEVADNLITEVMEEMITDRILRAKAKELGVLELTSADKDLVAAEAQAAYDEQVEFYRSIVREAGMSDEQVTAAAEKFLAESEGVTYDSIYADLEDNWWSQKLYDHVTKDVQVESGDVLALYQSLLEDQKATFAEYPDVYEYTQKSGGTIVYNPEGYRAVKVIKLAFEDAAVAETIAGLQDELETLDPQVDLTRISEIQNQLNAIYATPETKANAVIEKLAAGESFDSLLAQYGSDEGMKDPALRETGYSISAESPLWEKSVIDAAMALTTPGETSAAIRTMEGVYILSYVGEVTPGEVAMDQVVDAITAEALHSAQHAAYDNQVKSWIEAANVKYYTERMQ